MNYYVVDSFTEKMFGGNPAGVCPLDSWLPDDTLQNIAMENNLSETAFFVKQDGHYELRWFTPELEVDLCGHATLASAFVLFNFIEPDSEELKFHSQSGTLTVTRGDSGIIWLNFPARPGTKVANYPVLKEAFNLENFETYKSADLMVVVESEDVVRAVKPILSVLTKVKDEAEMPSDDFGIIVTAPGKNCDFVSRFFAPNVGIGEDPVTGRAHCVMTPYWSKRLGKTSLSAQQVSKRVGKLWCEDCGDRIKIGGQASLYLKGEIML